MSDDDEDIRKSVYKSLTENGVLPKLEAQLRAAVYLALEKQDYGQNIPDTMKAQVDITSNHDGLLLMSLIVDCLRNFNLNSTIEVLKHEANLNLKSLIDTDSMNSLLMLEGNRQDPVLPKLVKSYGSMLRTKLETSLDGVQARPENLPNENGIAYPKSHSPSLSVNDDHSDSHSQPKQPVSITRLSPNPESSYHSTSNKKTSEPNDDDRTGNNNGAMSRFDSHTPFGSESHNSKDYRDDFERSTPISPLPIKIVTIPRRTPSDVSDVDNRPDTDVPSSSSATSLPSSSNNNRSSSKAADKPPRKTVSVIRLNSPRRHRVSPTASNHATANNDDDAGSDIDEHGSPVDEYTIDRTFDSESSMTLDHLEPVQSSEASQFSSSLGHNLP